MFTLLSARNWHARSSGSAPLRHGTGKVVSKLPGMAAVGLIQSFSGLGDHARSRISSSRRFCSDDQRVAYGQSWLKTEICVKGLYSVGWS